MSELINTFSWSISAREDFNECRRRRYWAKYAMWNGWNENAAPIQRAAYRLGKMDNRFSLVGNAVEAAVVWLIRRQQEGRVASMDEAYEAAAKPFLNRCWSESLKGLWKDNPKKYCCLHEHYYREFARKTDKEMVADMIAQVKQCLANFITKVLPGLAAVKRDQEIFPGAVATKDPESFNLEDIKVYAIPDYVYLLDGRAHIHDWKSGAPRATHKDQMAIYGLWAALKHKLAPEKVSAHLEYLASGVTESAEMTAAELVRAQELVRDSVGEMAEYLVDGDLKRNAPLPKEDWELSAEINVCRRCSFYELCKPELET
jgi:hypothetical protein